MSRLGHPLAAAGPRARHAPGRASPGHGTRATFGVAVKAAPGGRRERIVGFGIGLQRETCGSSRSCTCCGGAATGHRAGAPVARPASAPEAAPRILRGHPAGRCAGRRGVRPPAGVLATCTDSAQPISNALYGKLGIVARLPVFNSSVAQLAVAAAVSAGRDRSRRARAARAGFAPKPGGPASRSSADDRRHRPRCTRYAHQSDHDFLRVQGRTGFLYRTSTGEPLGYGYSSQVGRFGPVALLDETLTAPVIGTS